MLHSGIIHKTTAPENKFSPLTEPFGFDILVSCGGALLKML